MRGWTTTVLCLLATYTQQACTKSVSTDRPVAVEASAPIEASTPTGSSAPAPAPPPETPPNEAVKTDSELGRDFASVPAYGQLRYPSFAQDDQITIEPLAQTPLVWLVDATPKINGTWHLFEQSTSVARYLLCHASGDWNGKTPTQTNGTWGPIEMVETIQPQGHQKTVRYEFSASLGFYVPTRCWRSEWPTPPENDPAASTASVQPTIVPLDCRKHVRTCD